MPTMPNVVGVNWQQATAYLIQAGVTPNNGTLPGSTYTNVGYFDVWPVAIKWAAKTGLPPGVVTGQYPAAATVLAFNTPVTLTVANYPFGVADLFSAGGDDVTPYTDGYSQYWAPGYVLPGYIQGDS